MMDPQTAYSDKQFKVILPAVIDSLGVERNEDHYYSYRDLAQGFEDKRKEMEALFHRDRDELSLVEKQRVDLYSTLSLYLSISRSLTAWWPDLPVDDPELAAAIGVAAGDKVSMAQLMRHGELLERKVRAMLENDAAETEEERGLKELVAAMNNRMKDKHARALHIVPSPDEEQWVSPWDLSEDLQRPELADAMQKVVNAAYRKDGAALEQAVASYNTVAAHGLDTTLELQYNKWDLFYRSIYLYSFGLIFLIVALFTKSSIFTWLSFGSISVGCLMHTVGVVMRMYIMSRPPISTLYESVIFAALVAVVIGLIIELFKRNKVGILCAGFMGLVLQLVGLSYAAEGDTMGMLVAVLDSNFWLATHVTSIVFGYGATMVAAIIAHVLLGFLIFAPDNKKGIKEIYNMSWCVALIALLTTTTGTILGGIWGDQSWGRFWGWDPKENGAMLIVLWLLVVIHGRIGGILGYLGYGIALASSTISVLLAWFGVNLLAVGLHNYGFDDGVATNLIIVCGGQVLLLLVAGVWISAQRAGQAKSKPPKTTVALKKEISALSSEKTL